MFHRTKLLASLAGLAALTMIGTATACSGLADTSQSVVGADPSAKTADKAYEVNMQFANDTGETLTLVSATHGGTGVHWMNQAPTTLDPGDKGTASAYAAWDPQTQLVYQGADDNVKFTLFAETHSGNLTTPQQIIGTATVPQSYTVQTLAGSGASPYFDYSMEAGATYNYTGNTQQFVVPVGIHKLAVTAIGGAGGTSSNAGDNSRGAQISGTLAVTPGETFTVGVGGTGGGENPSTGGAGGWGMDIGDDSYSGGNGIIGPSNDGAGGGATVIRDASNNFVVIAGGGGGQGATDAGGTGFSGGSGGDGGSLAGGDGAPVSGGGGKAGGNNESQGQDAQSAGGDAGGAGGGGAMGGLAGIGGSHAGGGAGSSSADGLTDVSVSTGPQAGNANFQVGSVTFGPTN